MFYVLFKAEFEIGKGLFENLENSKSDLPNFWKFENWNSFQMNEPFKQPLKCFFQLESPALLLIVLQQRNGQIANITTINHP